MSKMQPVLKYLEKVGRKRIIPDRDGEEDYLDRYYLLWNSNGMTNEEKARAELKPHNFNMFLHQFKKSDDAGLFHDHPWDFMSIILTEGYYEHTPEKGRVWHGPGSIIFHKADDLHWVELKPGSKPVTLFIHFKKREQPWGFLHEGRIVPKDDYLLNYRNKHV